MLRLRNLSRNYIRVQAYIKANPKARWGDL